MKRIVFASIILFWCVSGLWAQPISNEQIYRELKVFQTKTKEQLKSMQKQIDGLDKRIDDLIHSIDKRFDMMQTQINNMMILIAALITGMVGFAGYLAHDRRKFQRDILEIQSETQIQKLIVNHLQKTVDETKAHGEKITQAITEQSKKDKDMLGSLKKAGIL